MILGILSDTHGRVDAMAEAMRVLRGAGADFFIHCGDTVYADGPIQPEVRLPDGSLWRNLVTPEVAKHDMSDYDFIALEDQLGEDWLGSAGKPGRVADVLKRTADFLVEQKSIRSVPALEAFRAGINTTFIEQAIKA